MAILGEFETVTGSDPLSRYRYFLNVVIDTSEVWVCRTDGGGLYTIALEDREVIPLFARQMFIDRWARRSGNLVATGAPLDEFVESELSAEGRSDALVSVMPVGEDWGHIVEIARFCRDIRMELDLIT